MDIIKVISPYIPLFDEGLPDNVWNKNFGLARNSPDLNPIENCWLTIGMKFAAKKTATKIELQKSIFMV